MGIVNINDDSFSGDGSLDLTEVWDHTLCQIDAGADIIDVGAESARTNRAAIPWQAEVDRLVPFLNRWQEWCAGLPAPSRPWLSINTWRTEVIDAVLPIGGDLINDMSALPTAANAEICARHGAALLIMHSVGLPKVAHNHVSYPDIMEELTCFFTEKIRMANAAGLSHRQLILDPGIDFAKQTADNLALMRHLSRLRSFGIPLLLPVSRKTMIGDVLGIADPRERDAGTVACIVAGLLQGASIFRVHHVSAARDTIAAVRPLIAETQTACG